MNRDKLNCVLLWLYFLICPPTIAEDQKFVINTKKAVAEMSISDLHSLWTVIKVDYPEAGAIFSYDFNKVTFCLFDLKIDNIFIIYASQIIGAELKLIINDEDNSDEIAICYLMVSSIHENNIKGITEDFENRYVPIGIYFNLDKNANCRLVFEADFNIGRYKIDLYKNDKGWWTGNTTIIDNEISLPKGILPDSD